MVLGAVSTTLILRVCLPCTSKTISPHRSTRSTALPLDQTSVIYYEDPKTGQDVVLRKLYGGANRTWVKYEDIPKNLIHACIAIRGQAL